MTVDIMLPYYGDVALMQSAVRSVLSQNHEDWRLTVVDDGYPDTSVPSWFAALGDERVRYFRNEEKLGAQGNHRRCLGYVKHDLFVVMGADDVMLPNYLDVVLGLYAAVPEAAIIQPGVQVIDDRGVEVRTLGDTVKKWYAPRGRGSRVLSGEPLATSLLRGNWLYNPSLCWRTSALDEVRFRENVDVFDLALPLDVVAAGESMVVDDTLCFKYRRHRSSSSWSRVSMGSRFPEERRFFLAIAEEMDSLGWHRAARAARIHLSSRLNAACQLPLAARRRDRTAVRSLSRHVLSR
ncbi:MAG: glycosyltransferase [Pseudonocardiaceae bacterium]|nr:glycosyltransferase [Pseudonocardiaceae bacterium]